MKNPSKPQEPCKPLKPQEPPKEIVVQEPIGYYYNNDCIDFAVLLEKYSIDDLKQMSIILDYGYYDSGSMQMKLIQDKKKTNIHYNKEYARYLKNLEKYNKNLEKYNKNLEEYNKKEKVYQEQLKLWEVWADEQDYLLLKQRLAKMEKKREIKSKKDK